MYLSKVHQNSGSRRILGELEHASADQGRGNPKNPKPPSLRLLKNFYKEFSARFPLSAELKPLTTASRVGAAGGKDDTG